MKKGHLLVLALLIGCGGSAPPAEMATSAATAKSGKGQPEASAGDIHALSADEIRGYAEGRAMRFARAAEKNHNPAPYFVLKYRSELGLFDEQLIPVKAILDHEHAQAARLGKELLADQAKVELMLGNPTGVHDEELAALVREIARINGEIRLIHIEADVATKKLLRSDQQVQYDAIRSYDPEEDGRDAQTGDGVCGTRP
jgi:hypothetical protein